jgi:hypothetical protein
MITGQTFEQSLYNGRYCLLFVRYESHVFQKRPTKITDTGTVYCNIEFDCILAVVYEYLIQMLNNVLYLLESVRLATGRLYRSTPVQL